MKPVLNPISNKPLILSPTGGNSGLINGGAIGAISLQSTKLPLQLIGAVPLVLCTQDECRTFNGDCYFNPVFGTINTNISTYTNDLNQFYIYDSMRRYTFWYIQKLNQISLEWEDIARVGASTGLGGFPINTSYGTYYNYNHWPLFPNYQGYQVNWGHVLTLNGPGKYRIRLETPSALDTQPQPFPYCMASEPFEVMWWDCERAHGTVKFESYQSGRIGSITSDGLVFDICNISLYDSLRHKGFFGREISSYDEILLEHQLGKIDRVRDEAIQEFTYDSKLMPKYVHDRFKSYFMMADSLFVSDYNRNNSDYDIKKKSIVKAWGYEPKYTVGNRLLKVNTKFKEGIQGVIKSRSCQIIR